MKSKGKTWSRGKKFTFAVCRKPDSKSPQYLSLGDLEKKKFFAKVNLFYNNRPASLKNFAFLVKHAYLSFTHFRVIDCTLLSYLVNCPFSYNTLHSVFTNLPNNFYLFISAFATCGLCFSFILLQEF